MDKQEAIEILRELQLYELPSGEYSKAVDIAINALKNIQEVREEINDLRNNEALLKNTKELLNEIQKIITKLIEEDESGIY